MVRTTNIRIAPNSNVIGVETASTNVKASRASAVQMR